MPEKTELTINAGEKVVTSEAALTSAVRKFKANPIKSANLIALIDAARAFQDEAWLIEDAARKAVSK